jgi:CBS domain-containing protein
MVPNPVCFPPIMPVKEVLRVLQKTTHHGFPVVVDTEAGLGVGQLEGLVLRSQLLVLLRERCAQFPEIAFEGAVLEPTQN